MTEQTDPILTATLALRKPDGRPLDDADVLALAEGTILVVQVDARPAADPGERVIVTTGRVIGWVDPAMRHAAKAMLIGAVKALRAAFGAHAASQPHDAPSRRVTIDTTQPGWAASAMSPDA